MDNNRSANQPSQPPVKPPVETPIQSSPSVQPSQPSLSSPPVKSPKPETPPPSSKNFFKANKKNIFLLSGVFLVLILAFTVFKLSQKRVPEVFQEEPQEEPSELNQVNVCNGNRGFCNCGEDMYAWNYGGQLPVNQAKCATIQYDRGAGNNIVEWCDANGDCGNNRNIDWNKCTVCNSLQVLDSAGGKRLVVNGKSYLLNFSNEHNCTVTSHQDQDAFPFMLRLTYADGHTREIGADGSLLTSSCNGLVGGNGVNKWGQTYEARELHNANLMNKEVTCTGEIEIPLDEMNSITKIEAFVANRGRREQGYDTYGDVQCGGGGDDTCNGDESGKYTCRENDNLTCRDKYNKPSFPENGYQCSQNKVHRNITCRPANEYPHGSWQSSPTCVFEQQLPSPSPSPSPKLECTNLTFNTINGVEAQPDQTPQLNDEVTFTCRSGSYEPDHFEFQYSFNGGNYQSLAQTSENRFVNNAWEADSEALTVETGSYIIQCRVCFSTDSSNCTQWGQGY